MKLIACLLVVLPACFLLLGADQPRPRAREFGVKIGILSPGPGNATTDVAGVRVGQVTVVQGEAIRTRVTAVR